MRALIDGRYNVSYADIDALAYPVLRHRMKINYTAINEKLTVDDVIAKLIAENAKDKGTGKLDDEQIQTVECATDEIGAEQAPVAAYEQTEVKEEKKKKLFGKKSK